MGTVRLDKQTELWLADLLAKGEASNPKELIERLIRERWLSLQLDKTIVERHGGHPQYLLQDAPSGLSERENRKQAIAGYLKQRNQGRNA